MIRCHIVVTGSILLFVFAACQAPEPPTRMSRMELPIYNGTPDFTDEHMAVVFTEVIDGGWLYWCTGTLIAPTVVLTAAHCAEGWEPEQYTVYFGHQTGDFEGRQVTEIIYHPDWTMDGYLTDGNDVALLRLAAPAPAGIAPIPHLPADQAITDADIGQPLEYVGFGRTENDTSGEKLTVTVPLWLICSTPNGCTGSTGNFNYNMANNTICHLREVGGTCSGDSGGPAFVIREDQEYVVGVNSYGQVDGSGNCINYGCATKIDVFETFINDFIGTFGLNGQTCSNPAQCYSGFCVDGVCCENACDIPCMTCVGDKTEGLCAPAPDGVTCPDSDPCDGVETCVAGMCTGEGTPITCTSPNPCVTGSCETGTGCVFTPITNGSACDNANTCDGVDHCMDGHCVSQGSSLDCDDSNVCTVDSCDPLQGCQNNPVTDGTDCADSDRCNGTETCQAGVCAAGVDLNCDDQNACTTDSCDSSAGCKHESLPEGDSCGDGRSCQGGLCLPKSGGGCSTAGAAPAGSAGLLLLLALAFLGIKTRSD